MRYFFRRIALLMCVVMLAVTMIPFAMAEDAIEYSEGIVYDILEDAMPKQEYADTYAPLENDMDFLASAANEAPTEEAFLHSELRRLEAVYGGSLTVDGILTAEHINIAENFLAQSSQIEIYDSSDIPDAVTTRASHSGTASVWAGIPAIGHCYINTPYTVEYTTNSNGSKNISSCWLGGTYMTGVALATWAFSYNTWSRLGTTQVRIVAYGTLSYGIPNTPLYYTTGLQGFQSDITLP